MLLYVGNRCLSVSFDTSTNLVKQHSICVQCWIFYLADATDNTNNKTVATRLTIDCFVYVVLCICSESHSDSLPVNLLVGVIEMQYRDQYDDGDKKISRKRKQCNVVSFKRHCKQKAKQYKEKRKLKYGEYFA